MAVESSCLVIKKNNLTIKAGSQFRASVKIFLGQRFIKKLINADNDVPSTFIVVLKTHSYNYVGFK